MANGGIASRWKLRVISARGHRMAYRLNLREPLQKSVRRVGLEMAQECAAALAIVAEVLTARAQAAREISNILGEDHDLALLRAFLNSETDPPVPFREISRIEALCLSRQAELRAQARPPGKRLLAEGSKGLRRRIDTYWRAAVDISDSQTGDGKARRSNRWPDQVHRI
jgi:hypothetical protein